MAAFSAVAVKGADIEGVVTFWRSPDPYFFMETASGAVWRVQRDAREPRVSVGDIVKAMHFTSANQFYRIYKRHFGRTVRQDGKP